MTDQVAAAVFVSDYAWCGDLVITHRVRQVSLPAPVALDEADQLAQQVLSLWA